MSQGKLDLVRATGGGSSQTRSSQRGSAVSQTNHKSNLAKFYDQQSITCDSLFTFFWKRLEHGRSEKNTGRTRESPYFLSALTAS